VLFRSREAALSLVEAFRPDVLVTQLGVDGHYSDPLTHLQLTTACYLQLCQELASLQLPWVALGGGGYALEAVPRCWAIAYGAMLDVVWPDLIPAGYRERYGLARLYDPPGEPHLDRRRQANARAFAAASVETIRKLVFPCHKLKAEVD
jgi:acetoin utilization protein AcuC